ncbi:PTS transporter subunit IIC [Streptomyces sp. KL116D]|uniref:PTS transporter subunit IIC n=1 Tax=Streptomyces sp. KL116D TaxID=3045152 RepID=UPI003558D8E8
MATAGVTSWPWSSSARALLGIMLVSMPAFAHPWTKRVTGNNTVAVGHFGTAGYIVSGPPVRWSARRAAPSER